MFLLTGCVTGKLKWMGFSKHFSHDSLGNDLIDELFYYESIINDYDPFSHFAELEDIGLSEDIELSSNDKDSSEFEKQLLKKYGET